VGRAEVILLDTHAAIWLATGSSQLGKRSRDLANQAVAESRLAISAISFWEIALLISKRRFMSERSGAELRDQLLGTGVTELPLTGDIASLAVELENLDGDPADRFIVATAVAHDAMLITADAALLRWHHKLLRHNART
jgi:PIN domain nuclease of toxin-antitoxin system